MKSNYTFDKYFT